MHVRPPRPRKKKRSRISNDIGIGHSYLPLNEPRTVLLLLSFAICYSAVIICLLPVLHVTSPTDKDGNGIPDDILEGARGREAARRAMQAVRGTFAKIKEKRDAMNTDRILDLVAEENSSERNKRMEDLQRQRKKLGGAINDGTTIIDGIIQVNKQNEKKMLGNGDKANLAPPVPVEREGFVILGMHRSGTSMMAGLLVLGMGYNTGGPLIQPGDDNEKGFFERIDVVLQNDEFFELQEMDWTANVYHYDWKKALEDKKTGRATFHDGEAALSFLNDEQSAPWLQKDPRMCITLRTWLELLRVEPAVVFTYRHPLEVAMSLKKRNFGFHLEHGLRIWIVYNMRAIQNSAGLCRVLSSNEAMLADPMNEVQRISDELTKRCGVPRPPRRLDQDTVNKFVDPKLQHNKNAKDDNGSEEVLLANLGNGCLVKDFQSDFLEGTPNRKSEIDMYIKAMTVYCDLQSGAAYRSGYKWPTLT